MKSQENESEAQPKNKTDNPKSKKYFVGTINDAPLQNITIGGFCFPNFTNELIKNDETSQLTPNKRKGDILELYDDEVKRIKDAASKKVVRWNANKTRAFIVCIDDKYKSGPNDELISKYIYLISLDEISQKNPMWREQDPAPLNKEPAMSNS